MEIGVKEAAEILKVSTKTIYRWAADGTLPFSRVGAQYRFSRGRLQEWLLHRSTSPSATPELPAGESRDFGLVDCVSLGGIHYRVCGDDVSGTLHEALQLTRLPDGCNRTLLWELLLAREALCSTGVGNGIALAHPRQAALVDLPHPLVSINFLESPVDFRAIDEQPVSIVILTLSPSMVAHLRVMSLLSFALHQQDMCNLLHRHGSRTAILKAFADCDRKLKDRAASPRHHETNDLPQ